MGDVSREDFLRAITDPDKFREFADQQGWGNKRRQMAWDALNNYAQGVQKGEINEIDSMHQVIDDTGVRTNKKERYNLIGSKFDANGAVASFMNQTAKGLSATTKDTSLKAIPSVSSYLNNLWFGSDTPDWALFQKNDVAKNGVYDIAIRQAKLKAGLQRLKNELTTNGAKYNWDGVDKNAYFQNLDNAISSSNIASYAPLGLNSEYLNNVLATKDLTSATYNTELPTQPVDENASTVASLSDDAKALYNMMTPEQKAQYIKNIKTRMSMSAEDVLAQQRADIDDAQKKKEDAQKKKEDANFMDWLKSTNHYSPKAQYTSDVSARILVDDQKHPQTTSIRQYGYYQNQYEMTNQEWNNFIKGDLDNNTGNRYTLSNVKRSAYLNGNSTQINIKNKLDWLNYNFNVLQAKGQLKKIGDDVSSFVGAPNGTVWRIRNSKRASDGTWMYMRKRGNNLEFYRSKSWSDLRGDYQNSKKVPKQQFGGQVGNDYIQYANQLKQRQKNIKAQENIQQANHVERTPLKNTRDSNKVAAGQRELGNLGEMTSADWAQLGGITADIASTAASFFGPAGTVVGAGVGLMGTGAHAYADFNDPSVSTSEAFTNLGVNLLYDAAGAVPILGTYGKLAKLGRVGKALQNNAKLYKIILGSISAPGVIQAAPNAASAVKKLVTKPSSITADELRDLSTAISIIAGQTKIGPNHNKVRINNPKYGQKVTVHTTEGKKTITAKDYEEIMKSPTMRGRNDLLGAATGIDNIQFNNGVLHNYAPSSWNPLNFEGFYSKFGIGSHLRDTSDPEPKYIFRQDQSRQRRQAEVQRRQDMTLIADRIKVNQRVPVNAEVIAAYTRQKIGPTSRKDILAFEARERQKRYDRAALREEVNFTEDYKQRAKEKLAEKKQKEKEKKEQAIAMGMVPQTKSMLEIIDSQIPKFLTESEKATKQAELEKVLPPYPVIVRQDMPANQIQQNAIMLHPTESNAAYYNRVFSPILTQLNNEAIARYGHIKPSSNDVKAYKSFEINYRQKQDRRNKAIEVMEAFKNTPSNNTMGHNKNTNLPHKKSNKKKKTSRDNNIKRHQNGGILYDYNFLNSVHAFRKGGIIKAGDGIKTYNNIYSADTSDYGYNTYLNKLFQDDNMLAQMRALYNLDDYAKFVQNNVDQRYQYGINDYQNGATYTPNEGVRTFNKGYQNDGNLTFNYTLFGNNADDYNNMQNGSAYKYIKFTRPAKAMQTGDAYNTDATKAYIDNAHGLQTYSRVASLTDANIKSGGFGNWGESWKQKGATGAYYYIAPNDKSGRGQWIPTADTTQAGYVAFDEAQPETKTKPETKKTSSATTPDIGKKSIFDKGKEYLANLTDNYGNLYNAVETLKYGLANKTTNDLAKIKMPNVAYTAMHTGYQTMDDLSQYNAYSNAAATNLSAATKHPITSSGQLQAAQQQEAQNANNKTMLAGNVERNTHLDTEREKSYKAGLYNMEQAVNNNNTNLQQWWKTRVQNEYTDPRARLIGLATNRQNYINALEKFNIIDPYTEQKNAVQQYNLAKAQWDYANDPDLEAAKAAYQKEKKAHENDPNWDATTSPAYKGVLDAQKKATAKYYTNMYSIYGIKHPTFTAKKGGKFEDISKFNTKEFYNTVRHSINTALKQGTDLSKLIISGKK